MPESTMDLSLAALRDRYTSGASTPRGVIEALLPALEAEDTHRIWISRIPRERLIAYATALEGKDPRTLPLYGVPFAIKDNIDLVDLPTTAACPAYSYAPKRNATVVQRLIDAGAIPVGKTNLDQFATGLVGVRSPMAAAATASILRTCPADRVPVPRSQWRSVSRASASVPTRPVRAGCLPPSTISSATSPRAVCCRHRAWSPRAGRSIRSPSSR